MLAFELANAVGALSFAVDYTWRGRVISTAFVAAVLWGLDRAFRRRLAVPLPATVFACASLLIAIDFFGDIFHFYTRWAWYDQVAHGLGGAILACAFLAIFRAAAAATFPRLPDAVLAVAAVGVQAILASAYEVEEYLEDYFYRTNRLGDGPDTANDIMLGLVGSIAVAAVSVGWRRWRKKMAAS